MLRIERAELQVPALVVDLELRNAFQNESDKISVDAYKSLWCLARIDEVPVNISFWDVSDDGVISRADLSDQLLTSLGENGREASLPEASLPEASLPEGPLDGSQITVVICTRNRPDGLRSTLASLRSQADSDFQVLVVDNGSPSAGTAAVTKELALPGWEYTIEPRPGLSRARNRGLCEVQTSHIAWLDDDEIADRNWIHRIKQGFSHESRPVAVCGVMLPAELKYEAQVRFEQYGGFNKGRGLEPEILKTGTPSVVSPLYPLPTFGPGGNMAFITDQLRKVGGFDPFLGAGTRTCGCEEMLVFSQLLSTGETVLHWPAAITWHTHRRDMKALQKQFYGFSAGITAFYASSIRSKPSVVFEILRLLPYAWRDMRNGQDNVRSGHLPDDFPPQLLKAWRRGLIEGAPMYVYEVLRGGLFHQRSSSSFAKVGSSASSS